MYSNNCVLAILHKGNVLRESSGEIHLPFGSEYKIRLKNNDLLCRVQAEVKIDGTLIHPSNQRFVIEKNGTLDLERMILDGNMNKGNKFKFVELSDSRVQDPTSSENGIIEVSFYKELISHSPIVWQDPKPMFPNSPYTPKWGGIENVMCNYSTSVSYISTNNNATISDSTNGATIEGGGSGQRFYNSEEFDVEFLSTTLKLKLVGHEEPTFVKNTRNKFCDSCGRKNRFKAKYCSNCGRKF